MSPGAKLFRDTGCGACHRLAAAGTGGTAGPSLDGRRETPARVERFLRKGGKGMVTYTDRLNDAQIAQLAQFVARSSR